MKFSPEDFWGIKQDTEPKLRRVRVSDEIVKTTSTSLKAFYLATLNEMITMFGEPDDGDDYKVSINWYLVYDIPLNPVLMEFYDWKTTSRYSGGFFHPSEFREFTKRNPYPWHIGSNASFWVIERILRKEKGIQISEHSLRRG